MLGENESVWEIRSKQQFCLRKEGPLDIKRNEYEGREGSGLLVSRFGEFDHLLYGHR